MLISYFELIRRHPRYLSFGIIHSFFSSLGQTFFISLFVPYYRSELAFNLKQFGLLYGLATVMSALLVPRLGALIDYQPIRRYSTWNGLGLALSCILMAASHSVITLFLGIALLRLCGQALMAHICTTSLAKYFHKDRGKALAVGMLGHALGEGLFPAFTLMLLEYVSIRACLYIFAASVIIVFIPLVWLLIHNDDPFSKPLFSKNQLNLPESPSFLSLFKHKAFVLLMPSVILVPLIATGFLFYQMLLATQLGWSMEWLAMGFGVLAMTRIIAALIVGPLIDQFSGRVMAPICVLPMSLGLLSLLLPNHPANVILFFGGIGITIGLKSAVFNAIWAELFGTKTLGSVRATIIPILVVATAVAPPIWGWILDAQIPLFSLVICNSVLLVLASVSCLFASKLPPASAIDSLAIEPLGSE